MNGWQPPDFYGWDQARRRSTTAVSILDLGAWLGLAASTIFWNAFFWQMTAPAGLLDMALSVALAAGYALILPMLVSLLAPSTPAGQALAQTKYKTIGNAIAVGATLFMCFHAFTVLWSWWAAKPAVVQTQQDLWMAIGTAIIFIVVPALAWVQIAPDRWVAEIVQAQQVRRLQAAQKANLMAAEIQYARAMTLLRRGLANATVAERQELAGTLIALQRTENEAIERVSDQLRLVTGIDTGVRLLDDPRVEQQYHQLTTQMERLLAPINEDDYVELPPLRTPAPAAAPPRPPQPAPQPVRSTVPQQDAETHDRVDARTTAFAAASADRHGPPRTANANANANELTEAYQAARSQLGGAWSRAQLEKALTIQKTKASELIREWKSLEWVRDVTNPAHHYAWTEGED